MGIVIVTEICATGTWQQYVKAYEELNYEYRVIEIELRKWVHSYDFKEYYELNK